MNRYIRNDGKEISTLVFTYLFLFARILSEPFSSKGWVVVMNATDTRTPSRTIENALLITVFWGGAWALGFLLGFG